jgi:hypothetical protein
MRLNGLPHDGNLGFEQFVQLSFLLFRQRRFSFDQGISQPTSRSGGGNRCCRTSSRSRCAAWSGCDRAEQTAGIAKRTEIHVLSVRRRAEQEKRNQTEASLHSSPQLPELKPCL